MPAALSANVSPQRPFLPIVLSGTGLTASTAYVLTIARATGATSYVDVTTDGAGAFSYTFTAGQGGAGTVTFSVRPRTEHTGTTTAAASTTAQISRGG